MALVNDVCIDSPGVCQPGSVQKYTLMSPNVTLHNRYNPRIRATIYRYDWLMHVCCTMEVLILTPKVLRVFWEKTTSKVAPVKCSLKFSKLNSFIHF